MTRQPPLLALTGVSKAFGGAAALRDVSIDVRAGEVHALVGMNGAGKSTLVGVMSGGYPPDNGTITLDGVDADRLTPRRAREAGISIVPQRRTLVPQLTVAENLFLGVLPKRTGAIDWRRLISDARTALERSGLDIDPRIDAGLLSVAEQTMVEITREVNRGGRLLIMDEPTASLGGSDARAVRDLVRRLSAEGTAVVYISHHLDEILDLADRVTVLRDGRRRLTRDCTGLDVDHLVAEMVGDSVVSERPTRAAGAGEERLRIDALTIGRRVREVTIGVRSGEAVGILGPAGGAQAHLFDALSGRTIPDGGTLAVDRKRVRWGSVSASLASGLRCVTGDRGSLGLVGDLTVDENITMARRRAAREPLINWRAMQRTAEGLRRRFGVATIQRNPEVGMLSGGNQQKVLLGKWLESDPEIVLFEDPTGGVDIAAKADIHGMIDALVEGGASVLIASSDVQEVMRLADRILVVSAGRVVAERAHDETTPDELAALTLGHTTRDAPHPQYRRGL